MSSFTSPLIVTPCSDNRNWKLIKKFTYHVGSRNSREVLSVPKGFITDFASVPQFLWFWLPAWGRYGKASVLHDYLYSSHERTRLESDNIFWEAMIAGGTPKRRAFLMWLAVRLFGGLPWKLSKTNPALGVTVIQP